MATITKPETAPEPAPIVPDDALYEIVAGQVVEKPMGTYPVEVATILSANLDTFVRSRGIGRAITEALFRIDAATQYRPDVAFVSYGKWPKGRRSPRTQPWEIVPDLAIEVISETDRAGDVLEKARDYFRAGVKAVWLVYPSLELVHVYESFTRVSVLIRDDDLDGGPVIPGFRLPLADLFQEETDEGAGAPAP